MTPGERTPAGRRRYSDTDVRRLHRGLALRGFGFPLERIRATLDAEPDHDPTEPTRRNRSGGS